MVIIIVIFLISNKLRISTYMSTQCPPHHAASKTAKQITTYTASENQSQILYFNLHVRHVKLKYIQWNLDHPNPGSKYATSPRHTRGTRIEIDSIHVFGHCVTRTSSACIMIIVNRIRTRTTVTSPKVKLPLALSINTNKSVLVALQAMPGRIPNFSMLHAEKVMIKILDTDSQCSTTQVHESSVGLSSTTNPSLGVAIPVPAQTHLYTHAKGRAFTCSTYTCTMMKPYFKGKPHNTILMYL